MKARLLAVSLLLPMLLLQTGAHHKASVWSLKWSTSFGMSVPLGRFSGCNHNAGTARAYCSGLPAALRPYWWAYPSGWPDTATERGLPVHGYYEPQDTVWISGGQMHVRLFRNRGTGHNASAAVVPMKAFGQRYGKFVETWNVSKTAVGFKSAHLLWPVDGSHCCENDFPEADWDGKKDIFAFSHNSSGRNAFWFSAGVPFSDVWHTSTIAWTPSSVTMYLDGKKLGTSSVTPTGAEEWVLQNESSLDGERAALGSSAQMNIRYVAVYSYR